MAPPPNRSAIDPADTSAPEAAASYSAPNLTAGTRVYLDPSLGEGAQKMDMKGMDHSKMRGMKGMKEMDHGAMGKDEQQPAGASGAQSGGMQGMDHSKMPGMGGKQQPSGSPAEQPGGMEGMKQPGAASQAEKEAVVDEMKKTSDEMKKLSDEMKAQSDAKDPGGKSRR